MYQGTVAVSKCTMVLTWENVAAGMSGDLGVVKTGPDL